MNHTAASWIDRTKAAHINRRGAAGEAESAELRRAHLTLDSLGDAVLSIDLAATVTYLNPVAERMTGWARHDAVGRPLAEVLPIIDATTREPAPNPMNRAIAINRTVSLAAHSLLVSRDGSEMAIEDSASPIHDQGGLTIGAVIVFRDVSRARALSQQAFHLAQHDGLTDLPNRVLLDDRLTQAIAAARRHGHRLAVLFLDLDGFKQVNDSRGHVAGDLVLQSVAQRLVACVRSSDTVSRQGGDEFVVLLPEITHADDAAVSAQKIVASLASPHTVERDQLDLTVTIGISIYPDDGQDADTLVRCADAAMYGAKACGRNTYRFFQRDVNARAAGPA
jgi:diguanylate cyclase (GGDEF)-like protein/PAS domain S-box-containing protein